MSDLAVYVNSKNGDYLIRNGCIQNNNSLLTEIYFCLATPLGSYIYNKSLGNNLLNKSSVPTLTEIQQGITNALSVLIRTRRISNVNIQLVLSLLSAYTVSITCIDNTGNPVEFIWTKI